MSMCKSFKHLRFIGRGKEKQNKYDSEKKGEQKKKQEEKMQ